MYARDARLIQRYAQSSPEALQDVVTFVLVSIRNPIEKLPDFCDDVRRRGKASRYLWGSKRSGFEYWDRNASRLYREAQALHAADDTLGLLLLFRTVPGLDLPKAGFCLQLAYGRAGCLDSHNLARFGLKASSFRTSGKLSEEAIRRKALHYLDVIERLGGCAALWDSWCAYVASRRPATFAQTDILSDLPRRLTGADVVSALHVVALSKLNLQHDEEE